MPDPIRVGVIGAHAHRGWGRWAHLPALAGLADCTIVAVASATGEGAEEAAQAWGAPLAFSDAHMLVNHSEVDLVTMAVQLPRRDDMMNAAIRAGKHVYNEWPVAIDAAAAARYRDAAAAAGIRSAVGLQGRHHPAVRFAADMVAQGRIGQLLSASLTFSLAAPETTSERYADLFDEKQGVNHLTIVGGHALDLFRFVAGEFTAVSSSLVTRTTPVTVVETGRRIEVTSPDQIAVAGTLRSGAAASAHIMTGGPSGNGFRIELHGRGGRLELVATDASLVAPQFELVLDDGDKTAVDVPDLYRHAPASVDAAVANVRQVYRDLAHAIRSGVGAGPDLSTAVQLHQLLDAISRSAETGERQAVP